MIYIEIPEKAKVYHELYLTEDYEGRKSLKSKITKFRSYHIARECYCTIKEGKLNKKCAHEMSNDIRDCFVQVYDFILAKFKEIVIGDLDTLYSMHQQYEQLIKRFFKSGEKYKSVNFKKGYEFLYRELKDIFINSYKSLSENNKIEYNGESTMWGAYIYVDLLECTVCPYCNAQFIITVKKHSNSQIKGRTRADLDHFLAKSKVPIFACSLYNLVPSCKICNSSFKHQQETDYHKHFSPFDKRINNYFRFQRTFNKNADEEDEPYKEKETNGDTKPEKKVYDYVNAILGESNDFQLSITPNPELDLTDKKLLDDKVINNTNLFRLDDVYKHHRAYVQKMIQHAKIYNLVYLEQLKGNFPIIFNNQEQFQYFIQTPKDEMKHTILGKVTTDIIKYEIKSSKLYK
ncbi:hypothetical protein [Peribacillus frigoritolerans]|uniref:hypothetical protein n=1 Tax=Peribacillus frigoritolerans TaxID=450367 RepID=UPI003B8B1143